MTENPYAIYTQWKEPSERFAKEKSRHPFSDFENSPFDFELFYSLFPEFEPPESSTGTPIYSRTFIGSVAKHAGMFVRSTWCSELDGADRKYAFMLAVAHIAVMRKKQMAGLPGTSTPLTGGSNVGGLTDIMPGVMTNASVGGISVGKTGFYQPRTKWEAWFNETPYGRTLLTFLEGQVAAGLYYEGQENIAECLRD